MAEMKTRSKPKSVPARRLPRRAQAVLDGFQSRILEQFPGEIAQLILFGSYARGEATADSDVDVMVVVRWDERRLPDGSIIAPISDPRWQAIIDVAADMLLESDLVVAPVVVGETRFREGFPLANRVKREGLPLWPNPN